MVKKLDQYLPYGKHSVEDQDIDAVIEVLNSDWLTQGPKVQEFESLISDFIGSKYAVACNSGTAALHLAYNALKYDSKFKVVVPGITFAATANAAKYLGGDVIFADIDLDTLCLEPDNLNSIDQDWDVVTPVHFAGNIPDITELLKIAKENNAYLIEDAAHALGSTRNGTKAGNFGDIASFSFHPVKHVAAGEGGLITTNNKTYFDSSSEFRTHGITTENMDFSREDKPYYYEMKNLGYNYRIPDILIALAISQFSRIEENLSQRNKLAEIYKNLIDDSNMEIEYQKVDENVYSAYHIFPIIFNAIGMKKRDKIFRYLRSMNVGVQLHYIPVYHHPYYRQFGHPSLPNCEYYYKNALTMPLFHTLTDDKLIEVFEILKEAYSKFI